MPSTYENPLIPHARMRALYRGLVELRLLAEHLPRPDRIPKNLEACWVATALDLREGDLTTDRAANTIPAYLRTLATRSAPKPSDLRSVLAPATKAFPGTPADRLFCAIGAAMALKAAATKSVALAYVRQDELTPTDWKRVLRVAAEGDLPLILVAISSGDLPPATIPVIPVDASDVVALYRVAQESLLRARAEGGVVVIECVKTRTDPIAVMAAQLTAKRIATPAWMAAVEARTRATLPAIKAPQVPAQLIPHGL